MGLSILCKVLIAFYMIVESNVNNIYKVCFLIKIMKNHKFFYVIRSSKGYCISMEDRVNPDVGIFHFWDV